MARLTSDSRKLAEIISWGMVDLIWGIGTMIGILIVLYIIHPFARFVNHLKAKEMPIFAKASPRFMFDLHKNNTFDMVF